MPAADQCVAIVAAAQVLCIAKVLPKIKAGQLEAALPLAIEESLLGDAEVQHVVPGAVTADGKTVLYAVDKARLRLWVEACAAASIRLRRVVPEYCLLPVAPNEWSLAWEGDHGLLAQPFRQGASLGRGDALQPPAALSLYWQTAQPVPEAVRVYADAGALPQWQDIPLVRGGGRFDWRSAPLTADMPNLLWGKFAPPVRLQEWWPKLQPLFWILLMVLCIEAVGYNLHWWSLAREKQQIRQTMTSVFHETFGGEVEVVDAPLQMQRSLARARHAAGITDDADFLPLLERVAAELATQAGSRVTGLRYTGGQLDVETSLPDRASFGTLQQRLSAQGLRIRILNVKEDGGAVAAVLRITVGEAG